MSTRAWTLAAAVAVAVAVVTVVLLFGLRPYPQLPSVADQPDPPVGGRLATVEYGPDGPCLVVVEGDGTRRELTCGREVAGEVVWLEDGHLAVRRFDPGGARLAVIDPRTGEVLDERPPPEDPPTGLQRVADDGRTLSVAGRSGTATLRVVDDGVRQVLLELTGPQGYGFVDAGWTADGRWVAVLDDIGRVLVVDASGRVGPRVWADQVGAVAVR